MLTTNSEVIKFNKEFYDFFTIIGGEINPIVNENDKVQIENYAIYIDPDDITKIEEQDYDSLYNTCIDNGRFYIRDLKHPDKDHDILIQAEDEKEIFLSEDALTFMKKGNGLIYFRDLDDDVKLFEMVIMNNELTKPLYDLMDLLNKQKSETIDATIESISQKFLDLLVESKIGANVIAAELIINRLVRSALPGHEYERPDFSKKELEPYEIYTVRKALIKNKSPLIGLSFQDIKRQLLSDELYTNRTGTSYIDEFYKTEVPTDKLEEYQQLADEMYNKK